MTKKLQSALIAFLGIVTAVLLGMLLLTWQGYDAFSSYGAVFKYSLASPFALGTTLERTAIVGLVALAATTTFTSGASNLGMFGQIMAGAIAATAIGSLPLPGIILVPLMFAGGALAGAFLALIAALLRKYFGMDEFITTLMFNFIMNYFTDFLVNTSMRDPSVSWPMSPVIQNAGVLPKLFGFIDISFFLVVFIFVASYIFWSRTRTGYEMRMMGSNPIFAKIGGAATGPDFMKAMLLSGAYSGMAGVILIAGSGQQNRFLPGMGENFANEGLMIAIVSNNNVFVALFYSLVFSILNTGSTGMQLETSVPLEFITMLIGLTVMAVVVFREASTPLLAKYKAYKEDRKLRKEGPRPTGNDPVFQKEVEKT